MLRNAIVVFAIVLVLGSSGLSTTAFARGGAYGDGAGGDSFRGNHFGGGFGGTRGDGYGGFRDDTRDLLGWTPAFENALLADTTDVFTEPLIWRAKVIHCGVIDTETQFG